MKQTLAYRVGGGEAKETESMMTSFEELDQNLPDAPFMYISNTAPCM